MSEEWKQEERRHYIRIEKHFIITYCEKNDPEQKHDISQLRNISLGGMCFVTSKKFDPNTPMDIELKTPYFSGTAHMEGVILESHEKVSDLIYETRLRFDNLSPHAEVVLKKIVETFTKIKNIEQKEGDHE